MKTNPYNRHETFLAALSDSGITVPGPLSREESYLAKIAGENVTIPDAPLNRYETYLAKLAGENVSVPTPVSRLETYMYKACGYDTAVPTPVSREEVFWARYCGYDASSSIIGITDAADEPAKDVTVSIQCAQKGTGVPSSDNVREITGWQSVRIHVTKNNLCGGDDLYTILKESSAASAYDADAKTVRIKGSTANISEYILNRFKENTRYTAILKVDRISGSTKYTNLIWRHTDGTTLNVSFTGSTFPLVFRSISKSSNTADKLGYFNATGSGIIDIYCAESGVFEGVVAISDYEEYAGKMYTIDISGAGTVYGGTLDVTTGLLTVTHGYIASYDGEELPGAWISSMDVYAPGTTPTSGAQVVYELAEQDYEVYQLQYNAVQMLEGVNNIWADCGPVKVNYIPDI